MPPETDVDELDYYDDEPGYERDEREDWEPDPEDWEERRAQEAWEDTPRIMRAWFLLVSRWRYRAYRRRVRRHPERYPQQSEAPF